MLFRVILDPKNHHSVTEERVQFTVWVKCRVCNKVPAVNRHTVTTPFIIVSINRISFQVYSIYVSSSFGWPQQSSFFVLISSHDNISNHEGMFCCCCDVVRFPTKSNYTILIPSHSTTTPPTQYTQLQQQQRMPSTTAATRANWIPTLYCLSR